MQKLLAVVPLFISMMSLCSCAGMGQDQTIGTVSGGALGALAGTQVGQGNGRTVAIVGGTALGALMGSSIGSTMDKVSQE